MHATRRKNLWDTLYIIHIPDVYHQFLVVKGKDIYLKQKNDIEISKNIACERPLWGTLGAGQKKEGQLATTSLEFEFHLQFPSGSPSTELSDFCQSAQSRNKHEYKQPLILKKHRLWVMTSLLVSSLPIKILHQLFQSRYLNSRDIVASSSSFSRPAARAP